MSRNKGFTLIELMVIIIIIGILAGLAINRYRKQTLLAKVQEAVIYVKYLQSMEHAYYVEHGVLPHQDGTLLYIADSGPANKGLANSNAWKRVSNRAKNRLQEIGIEPPVGDSKFWYLFTWYSTSGWSLNGNATEIIYAYPKRRSDFFNFPDEECDGQLKDVVLAIDNDGSVYVWGVPGMEWIR
ncbi:MAG: prepilin-type N-terminal cleavage/methylation domain-containing protein [Candidatus Zixiibacteriota bacterium]